MTHADTTTGHALTAVTDDTFARVVLASDRPVLVDFWAQWCGPCHQLAPVLAAIAEERADSLSVVTLNADENPVTATDHRVLGLPTMILFRDGRPVLQLTGARPKSAIDRELDRALA